MNTVVIYDSRYGNTEQVARAMGDSIDAQVLSVEEVSPTELNDIDLLIIGSPTHGGFPTEGINNLVKASLVPNDVKVAVFDTRTKRTIFGYAAPRMAQRLEKNGGILLAPPEGFFVLGMEGPLMEGELERAIAWAKELAGLVNTSFSHVQGH
jgi:flavodoxin I